MNMKTTYLKKKLGILGESIGKMLTKALENGA